MFWGLSESLDLCQEYLNAFKLHQEIERVEKITEHVEKLQDPANSEPQSETSEKSQDSGDGEKDKNSETPEHVRVTEIIEKIENVEISSEVHTGNTSEIPNLEEIEKESENKETLEHVEKNAERQCVIEELPRVTAGQEQKEETVGETHTTFVEDSGAAGDFLQANKTVNVMPPRTLNILLFGSADPRHVLHTMAKLYKHQCEDGGQPDVNFYVVEGCIETMARYIALLGIALENTQYFSLLVKTHLFMDVYGNSLLRPSSHQYLAGKAKTLLKILTDADFLQEVAPMLCIEGLKYRERDGLEQAFYFWYPKKEHAFDIKTYWENRNRKLLGTRYDYRNGAFDWDLSMTLKHRQAQQICSQEYRYWRETGIAFTFPEYEQCQPNKTLAAGLIRNGSKYHTRGYVGDIQTGPFCAFGLKTEQKSMCQSVHGENDYRATEVTERNLIEIMHELQHNTPYKHNSKHFRKLGPVRLQMCKRLTTPSLDTNAVENYDQPWLNRKNVKINFLSMDEIANMQKEECSYTQVFDIVFVGHQYFTFLKENFTKVLKPKALLLLETKLLTLGKNETVSEFDAKLQQFAKTAKLKPLINYNAINSKNTILKYKTI